METKLTSMLTTPHWSLVLIEQGPGSWSWELRSPASMDVKTTRRRHPTAASATRSAMEYAERWERAALRKKELPT